MKSRFLCSTFLTAVVLVESSSGPFSSKTTQASFQTGAYAAYSDTSSDVLTTDDDIVDYGGDITGCADLYAAVGILDLYGTSINDDSIYDESKILLRNHLQDGNHSDEWWGVKKATSDNRDANNLVLSSMMGSSCDGFVINLSDSILNVINTDDLSSTDDGCLEILDDILVSLADSLIHRLQAGGSTSGTVIQMVIVKEECNYNVKMSKTADYIEKYLDRAISKLQSQKFGRTINDSSPIKCDIEVSISSDSAVDSAVQLAILLLPVNSVYGSSIQMIRDKLELIDDETSMVSTNIDDIIPKDDTTSFRDEAEFAMTAASSAAEDDLYEIENKMDDAVLEGDGNVPMPEFGSDANALLTKVSEAYLNIISNADTLTDEDREWIANTRIEALKNVAGTGLHRLYCLHLQNLRDHFGRTYEQILDESSATMGLNEMEEEENTVQARDQLRREGAKRAEEGFLNAAFLSIPSICQDPEMGLGELYSCTEALRGLLEDMYEATMSRGIEEEEWNDVMDISAEEAGRLNYDNNAVESSSAETRVGLRELIKRIKNKRANRGPAKWYERLAANALVIGVNYVQGWIVLQTLRREARRRDLTMPKFPLF